MSARLRTRIALSTIHASDNYGSVLQALCLSNALEQYGAVEILDHRPLTLNAGYALDWLPAQPMRRRMNPEFGAFIRKHMRVTHDHDSLLPLSKRLWRRPAEAQYRDVDIAVVGSDEVWSAVWGHQPQFFLEGVPDHVRRVAYGASVGRDSRVRNRRQVIDQLARFSTVLVRDQRTAQYCADLGREVDGIVCDPVLLQADLLRSLAGERRDDAPYTLVYSESCKSDDPVRAAAKALAKSPRLVSVGFPFPDALNRVSASLREFVALIANAELVVTTMYHGVITALSLGVPVVVIDHPLKTSKVSNFLEQVGACTEDLKHDLKYVVAAPGVARLRESSRQALSLALS